MKWTTVLFWLWAAGTKQLISPVPKGAERQKGDWKSKQVFKGKILIKVPFTWESSHMRIIFLRTSATCMCMSAQSECKHFHNTRFDLPLSLHANYTLNPTILHTLCNSFKQNQSSALPGYPSLFLTILKARTPDNTIDASSARVSKLDTTPHKMTSLYHYSLRTWFEY